MQQVAEVKPSASSAISERTFADLLTPLIEPGFRLALAMLHDAQAAEDDMPLEDIAGVARASVGATRARLYRSIRKLRPDLDLEEALR